MIAGASEFATGTGLEAGGMVASIGSGGTLAVVGVPVSAGGLALATTGAAVAAKSATSFMADASKSSQYTNGNSLKENFDKNKVSTGSIRIRVNQGQQDKHILGTNNYKQEVAKGNHKSILTKDAQMLLDKYADRTKIKEGTNKQRIHCDEVIGKYYNVHDECYYDTTNAIIHYDKKGAAHIVPARPEWYKGD
ncbi:polymorphic toxin type 50 domain-containing protein [Selenomonas sp. WCT3]|uniref:polymorphic toxin type 50 domain-containing protein n=1 Tax=Selenomonas sp. WCT3 TaxID=3158785 RepID=UPI0011798B4C